MSNYSMFGRYEYRGGSKRKFWHIVYDLSTETYTASWGRIGKPPKGTTDYTREETLKKIQEKLKKGYVKVKGYDETVGNHSVHYILNDEAA